MKVGYSKTYPIASNGTWEKIWAEEEFEGSIEDARKRWYAQKKEVENFHFESNKAAEKQEKEVEESPKTTEAKIIAQIYGCTDLKVLESFRLLSNNYKSVKAAYEQRQLKLKNQ